MRLFWLDPLLGPISVVSCYLLFAADDAPAEKAVLSVGEIHGVRFGGYPSAPSCFDLEPWVLSLGHISSSNNFSELSAWQLPCEKSVQCLDCCHLSLRCFEQIHPPCETTETKTHIDDSHWKEQFPRNIWDFSAVKKKPVQIGRWMKTRRAENGQKIGRPSILGHFWVFLGS